MKLDTFEKIIRKVIREEIDYALKRELTPLKEELSNNKPIIMEKTEDKATKTEFRQKIQQQMPSFNTGNGTLDSLLNETATTPSNEEAFNTNDPVNHFIKKDYRQLMSAMDKKKEHFRP